MGGYQYCVYGVTVLSDFPLSLPHGDTGETNLYVRIEATDVAPAPDINCKSIDDGWHCFTIRGDGSLYLRWEDLFDFVIEANGRRVLCRMLSDTEIESFEAYLTSFALSGALVQQGEELLHATVVATDSGAVGLIGPSGAGKSTLAAFLIGRGGELVTDDILRLEFRSNLAMAFPGPRRIKLFREPAERFLNRPPECARFNPLTDKFIFQTAPLTDCTNHCLRLSALYFLDTPPQYTDPASVSIERLSGLSLFKMISASTCNSLLNVPERLGRQFRFAERVAAAVPVYRLIYSRDYEILNQVADLIGRTASA